MELTRIEPAPPSLRKMWSNRSDERKRQPMTVLWGGCGPSHVRPGETCSDTVSSCEIKEIVTMKRGQAESYPGVSGVALNSPHGGHS